MPNSKRARRRREAILNATTLYLRRHNHAREALKRAEGTHSAWMTAPDGVLMYHLRMLRPSQPLRDGYSIEARMHGRSNSYGFVWDAPQGLVLLRNRKPCACIGFKIENDTVIVQQIQGARQGKDFFVPFAWTTVLLDAVVFTAYTLGYRRAEVVPAALNRWSKYRREEAYRRFVRLYDDTAIGLGFTRLPHQENYRLVLR